MTDAPFPLHPVTQTNHQGMKKRYDSNWKGLFRVTGHHRKPAASLLYFFQFGKKLYIYKCNL